MAGADRQTHNASGANITDNRATPANQTSNGLDNHFGAVQVNVPNSLAWHTTTVPVPAALPLLISGLAGFFWVGRRRTTG